MTRMTIGHVASIATLLFGTAASAASYTGHYRYVEKPAQHSDTKLQTDLATCDGIAGVQPATPSKDYQSCMLQNGWRFLYETRDKATASDAVGSNVKLKPGHYIDPQNGMGLPEHRRCRSLRST